MILRLSHCGFDLSAFMPFIKTDDCYELRIRCQSCFPPLVIRCPLTSAAKRNRFLTVSTVNCESRGHTRDENSILVADTFQDAAIEMHDILKRFICKDSIGMCAVEQIGVCGLKKQN